MTLDFRLYPYYELGTEDAYGQPSMPSAPSGNVLMALYEQSEYVNNSVNYTSTNYTGVAVEPISDKWVIDYQGTLLKVIGCARSRHYYVVQLIKRNSI